MYKAKLNIRRRIEENRNYEEYMDINPLIVDMKKYKEELIDSISIAVGFNELDIADEYVAHDIAEIKGLLHSNQPFQQISDLYGLPIEEVIENIQSFTNKEYKNNFHVVESKHVKDISFKAKID
jgi:GTPase involved in cell partitioning and DNA repair